MPGFVGLILVDTSVWIDHFHHDDAALVQFLKDRVVVMHPVVLGELLGGSGIPRKYQQALVNLPRIPADSADDVLAFIVERLRGAGVGWADAHILLSTMRQGAGLWTRDGNLAEIAGALLPRVNPWKP